MQNGLRRVVVTGMGAITPIGNTAESFWEGLLAGKSGGGKISLFDVDSAPYTTTFACEVKDFNPLDYIDRKAARRQDRFTQFAVIAADQAVQDAGIDAETLSTEDKDRTGVIFGSGIGGIQTFQEQSDNFKDNGPRRVSPFFIPMLIPDIGSGHISMKYGFRGPNHCVVSACATGNHNIGDAFMLIQRGMMDAAVCGGAEAPITPLGVSGFGNMKALSTRNDSPESASRPFDSTRDGFVIGEGAGALFIEELEHAKARGARIYAEIIGIGMSGDAYHLTAPEPNGNGARLAMEAMLNDAQIQLEEVDYLNMHGTSTPLGDVMETRAIKSVFGDHAQKLNLSSTKSMTGHLLGAAGAVEAIAAINATVHNIVPPTINFANPDPECDLNYTFNKPQEREVNVAISNAFGFGGHNTSVAFRKYAQK